jgi:hypothetical protein
MRKWRGATRPALGALVTALFAGLLMGAPAASAAPGLSVSPSTGVRPGATVSVSGSGYSTTANNGVGIYVAWCKLVPQYWASADNCGDARWLNGSALKPSGSFSVSLTLAASIAGTNCAVAGACKVVTMAAHGSSDRSQDAVAGVSFAPVAVTTTTIRVPAPTTKASAKPPVNPTTKAAPTPTALSTASEARTTPPSPSTSARTTTTTSAPASVKPTAGSTATGRSTMVVAAPGGAVSSASTSIAPSLAADDVRRDSGTPVWVWILLGGGILLAAALGGFAWRRQGRPS